MNYISYSIEDFGKYDFFTHTITDVGNLHTHSFFEISYVLRGTVKHITPTNTTYYSNDKFHILRPGDIHAFDERNNKGAYHRDVLISKSLFKSACDYVKPDLYDEIVSLPDFPVIQTTHDNLTYIEKSMQQLSSTKDYELFKALSKTALINLLYLFMTKSNETKSNDEKLIDNIIQVINTPDAIAKGIPYIVNEVNYSHGHLCRLIKTHLNKTLLEVLTDVRMKRAALLIKTTDTPITEIASIVGYDSLSHFITVFEKYYSVPPFQFRKKYK